MNGFLILWYYFCCCAFVPTIGQTFLTTSRDVHLKQLLRFRYALHSSALEYYTVFRPTSLCCQCHSLGERKRKSAGVTGTGIMNMNHSFLVELTTVRYISGVTITRFIPGGPGIGVCLLRRRRGPASSRPRQSNCKRLALRIRRHWFCIHNGNRVKTRTKSVRDSQ